ncbi:hypothetical protein IQ269_27835 [Tychonema sp. LEGE 07199]|nr:MULTISPECIES: hypothetical protein [unclassified Tychonema]MBE9124480.1 hypothetical protein [Tychonema sp. LEGE 07199]MBE9133577.1 hypothetical protein [Tychonema sp. LEGE 07196]
MALVAIGNFSLVLFDITYIPWRDFYFRQLPVITKIYDPFKGIKPHRDTKKYLETLEELKILVVQTGLQSPQVAAKLQEINNLTAKMIDEDPFQVASKSGALEKIKDRMRDRVPNPQDSAKQSFTTFWSQNYLNKKGWQQEITWFDAKIKPLIATNYYRTMGENGEFTDKFWQIDLPFMALFAIEFLARTYFISRRHRSVTWRSALLWRWYDIFLFLPFWRLLRVLPVIIRIHQAKMPDLQPIRTQISRGFVANFAQELTEVVVIRLINQMQESITTGELARQLFQSPKHAYLDINNINEIEAIATHLVQITVYKVLPQLQPDLEALLRYNIELFLKQSPLYQGWKQVPGLGNLPAQLAEQLVAELSKLVTLGPQDAYEAFKTASEDPVGTKLSSQLVQHFGQALGAELQQQQTWQEIQLLLSDFLEEFKINYIQRLSDEDFEQILEQAKELQRIAPR